MIKEFKIFELFDQTNIYPYKLESTKHEVSNGDRYVLYTYSFFGKENIKYFVRLGYFKKENDSWEYYGDSFITLDYIDESDYKNNKNIDFDLEYRNTNKFDAIRIINTVINILCKVQEELNPSTIDFNCTPDRYKSYVYSVKKYLQNYIQIIQFNEEDKKYHFYLFNKNDFRLSENGKNIIQKNNNEIVYI